MKINDFWSDEKQFKFFCEINKSVKSNFDQCVKNIIPLERRKKTDFFKVGQKKGEFRSKKIFWFSVNLVSLFVIYANVNSVHVDAKRILTRK